MLPKHFLFSSTKTLHNMDNHELIKWGLIIGIPLFILLFYKFILRVFFGVVIVPEDKIGLVTKKFVLFGKQQLPEGANIASGYLFCQMDLAIRRYVSIFHNYSYRPARIGIGKRRC
jgi:hypothetical protein